MKHWVDALSNLGINHYSDLMNIYKDINEHNVNVSESDAEYIIREIKGVITSLNIFIMYLEKKYTTYDTGEKVYAEDINTTILDNFLLNFFGTLDIVDYNKKINELQNELEKLTTINDDSEIYNNYN